MIKDRANYFNIDMRNVTTVPEALIDGIENDLPKILAQTPAEDKLELYVKYFSKAIDMKKLDNTQSSNDLGEIKQVLNDIGQRLTTLENKK
tara:strand:- start:453 stop:725 length:273 start_codon:yes stop_codon:yes gene_type:complete